MVELETISENRFYKLKAHWRERCDCGGVLWLHMKDASVNLICRHVGCFKEYEIARHCSYCNREHLFDDITCDSCEPVVINIATWKVSIDECEKAIKKVNRAFKNNLIDEKEWKSVLNINKDERERCLKNLEKVQKDLDLSTN